MHSATVSKGVRMVQVRFLDNEIDDTCTAYAGYRHSNASLTMQDTLFSGHNGSALMIAGADGFHDILLNDVTFQNNRAPFSGGAIWMDLLNFDNVSLSNLLFVSIFILGLGC